MINMILISKSEIRYQTLIVLRYLKWKNDFYHVFFSFKSSYCFRFEVLYLAKQKFKKIQWMIVNFITLKNWQLVHPKKNRQCTRENFSLEKKGTIITILSTKNDICCWIENYSSFILRNINFNDMKKCQCQDDENQI